MNERVHHQGEPVMPATSNPSHASSSAELRYYLNVLRRRWWLVSLVALVVMAGAYWRSARQVPKYTAETRVLREIKHNLIQDGWSGLYEMQPEAVAVQLELIRAHDVLRPVVDSLGLRLRMDDQRVRRTAVFTDVYVHTFAPTGNYLLRRTGNDVTLSDRDGSRLIARAPVGQALEGAGFRIKVAPEYPLTSPLAFAISDEVTAETALRDALRAEQQNQSMMIAIKYTDSDPVLAAAVANAVAESYRWQSGEQSRAQARQRSSLLRQRLSVIQDSLALAHAAVRDFNRQAGLNGLGSEENAMGNEVAAAQSEVRRLNGQVELLLDLRNALDGPGARDAIDRAAALAPENGGLQAAHTQIIALQQERARAMSEGSTPDSRRIIALDQQVASATSSLRRLVDANLKVTQERLAAAVRHEVETRARYGDVASRLAGVDAARQRVDALTQHYNLLAENYLNAQIAESLDQASVTVTQPAVIPSNPSGSGRTRTFFFALIIGSVLGVLAALVIEQVDTRVRDPEDAQRVASTGVLGMIPEMRSAADRPLAIVTDEQGLGAEAYRKLRTNLRFVRAERPRAIAVTSPSPEEGKSVTAANLALAIAQQGQTVLIVDADLRRPVQHEIFEMERAPGLSDALVGLVQPLAAAQPYQAMPNVYVMTCGTEAPNPAELLGSESFVRFLHQMLEKFDTVIIDTPPVNLVTDAAVIGSVCDGVLIVAEAGRTDRSVLANAVNELRHARGSVLGIVLNRAGAGTRYGKYGRYGGYYGNKPQGKDYTGAGNGSRRESVRQWVSALI
ncbi:MAG TPA: polysaccharide biosynthesis tyrosine autokinase [Longimicrobiales bacterium]|nr:polysaccharide biosynthesis tyrosine autokinase [Longimicrobiales bacterium]